MPEETSIGGERRAFPETRWSRILAAQGSDALRRTAMEELLAAYWKPLYFHARRRGLSVEDAKDAVQSFCVRLLSAELLSRLDPAKGRLRSYLRTALDRHLANLHHRRVAEKRGGGAKTFRLDVDVAERDGGAAAASDDPGLTFEREWAGAVMARALGRLEAEFDAGRWSVPFDVMRRFLDGSEPPPYPEVAAALGKTVLQIRALVYRARLRFREVVRDEVADTVADPSDVDAELGDLIRVLGRG